MDLLRSSGLYTPEREAQYIQWKALLVEYTQVEFVTLLSTSDSHKHIGHIPEVLDGVAKRQRCSRPLSNMNGDNVHR